MSARPRIGRCYRLARLALALSAGLALAGCESFEMPDMFVNKKKLPGERKLVFPEGVPGVTQGVPPELVKGNHAPPDTAAMSPPEAQQPEPPPAKPKPAPRPRRAAAPPAASPPPAARPAAQPAPAARPAQSASAPWPAQSQPQPQPQPQPQQSTSPWPASGSPAQQSPWPTQR